MSNYGYLIHSSTEQNDYDAVDAIFDAVPSQNVVLEQLWECGETTRPALEKLVDSLRSGDTLFIYSINCLGNNEHDISLNWHTITAVKKADIVVINDPTLDSRNIEKLTLLQVEDSARKAIRLTSHIVEKTVRKKS